MAEFTKAFVMCGVPGAGKSTAAKAIQQECMGHGQEAVILSFDAIREELYGDAAIQGSFPEINARYTELVELNKGKVLILDNTHCLASYRKDAISLLARNGYTDVFLMVVDRPIEVCLAQNASRERKVPEFVIEKMHNSLVESLANLDKEEFAGVVYM